MITRISVEDATNYIAENFILPGETIPLVHNVIAYAEEAVLPELKEEYLLEILNAIGLDESDIAEMRAAGIIYDVS